jgi:hypothetical protein
MALLALGAATVCGIAFLRDRGAVFHDIFHQAEARTGQEIPLLPGRELRLWFTPAFDRLSYVGLGVAGSAAAEGGVIRAALYDESLRQLSSREMPLADWLETPFSYTYVGARLSLRQSYCLSLIWVDGRGEIRLQAGMPTARNGERLESGTDVPQALFHYQQLDMHALRGWIASVLALGVSFLLFAVYPLACLRPRLRQALGWVGCLLSPVMVFVWTEVAQMQGVPWPGHVWAVLGLYLATQAVIGLLCGRSAPGQIAVTLFWWALGVISALKWGERAAPLFAWDIYTAGTAMGVLGGYAAMRVPFLTLVSAAGAACACGVSLFYNVRLRGRRGKRCAGALAAAAAAGACVWLFVSDSNPLQLSSQRALAWNFQLAYKNNGLTASLLIESGSQFSAAPQGYDPQAVRAALDGAVEAPFMDALADPPVNIVVVMNESLADLQAIVPFETDAPVTARLRALAAGGISGRLRMSSLGGGTDGTEFEFLTGNSMAFLPPGTTFYQQHMHADRGNAYSLASHLKAQGYATLAMHPEHPDNWGRSRAYPLMGFDRFLAQEALPAMRESAHLVRGRYGDAALYRDVLAQLRAKPAGSRLFLFCVTMQNHGGYLPPAANIPAVRALTPVATPEVDSYLSLVAESDRALGELAEALRAWPEPTLLCVFGDHQPSFSQAFFDALAGEPRDALAQMRAYQTPFLIWSNRGDLAPLEMGDISASYLGGLLSQVAGLPLSGYQRFLTNARAQWPVVTIWGAMDAEGRVLGVSEALAASATLRGYEAAQYNLLFDVEHKQTAAFE